MADQYYYDHNLTQCGPFPAARMRELAAAGGILPTDAVWKEGTAQKVSAGKVKNLFPALTEQASSAEIAGPPAQALAEVLPDVLASEAPQELPTPASAAVEESEKLPTPVKKPRPAEQFKVRKRRVVSIKGAILISQDGVDVRYRKKCIACGYEDSSRATMKIPKGAKRDTFFCPTCRRVAAVEIMGAG